MSNTYTIEVTREEADALVSLMDKILNSPNGNVYLGSDFNYQDCRIHHKLKDSEEK